MIKWGFNGAEDDIVDTKMKKYDLSDPHTRSLKNNNDYDKVGFQRS